MKYIYELHKTMLQQNLILVYEGEFTQEITKSVLAMAERNMESVGEESNIKRKVFNVMVECLQNICKHADEISLEENMKNSAIFMIGKHANEYIITTGNPINNDKVGGLNNKLEQINSLDKEGLKALYKDIIRNGDLSDKGGAGLGFVDMARKSGQKLEFDFQPINDKISFFSLKTTIPRVNTNE
ncbi:SiaB family protein kinase [Rhodocytophaga aerolata]|uniref:SiaB family protein kinase n=1 Tax=Rhodocytophaga aerolata TaxID=455078 RepID=A0ABT8R1V8_9BACT|nr:SiaB family protein kinase [Rhodocytophaga aerolata]MDO1446072.1 SiaB family protein kinase [Rhodocytophaga aerolata]